MTNKPKTIEQHKADGTYRKDRHERKEMATPLKDRKPPESLTEKEEIRWWEYVMETVGSMGVLTEMDVPQIIDYCRDRLIEKYSYEGIVQELKSHAPGKRGDCFITYREARDRITKFHGKFGMNPMDRPALNVPEDGEDDGLQAGV